MSIPIRITGLTVADDPEILEGGWVRRTVAETRRAEDDTGDDVADDRGLLEARHGDAAQQRDAGDEGDERQGIIVRHLGAECTTNPLPAARPSEPPPTTA